jgi:hypothetical protein
VLNEYDAQHLQECFRNTAKSPMHEHLHNRIVQTEHKADQHYRAVGKHRRTSVERTKNAIPVKVIPGLRIEINDEMVH